MPEWGMLPLPKKLLKEGVRDMLRMSDARMSGTSYGACILHVSPESHVGAATPDTPIVQSYVDIFVNGCLELQDRYGLDGFARECIDSTAGWSAHWVNDRIYPRRPFIYRKNAVRIDRLLQAALPEIFPQIRIE